MNSHLSLIFVYQRKYFLTRAVARAAMACRRLRLPPLAFLPCTVIGSGPASRQGKGRRRGKRGGL
jgi:hypothetical protein